MCPYIRNLKRHRRRWFIAPFQVNIAQSDCKLTRWKSTITSQTAAIFKKSVTQLAETLTVSVASPGCNGRRWGRVGRWSGNPRTRIRCDDCRGGILPPSKATFPMVLLHHRLHGNWPLQADHNLQVWKINRCYGFIRNSLGFHLI